MSDTGYNKPFHDLRVTAPPKAIAEAELLPRKTVETLQELTKLLRSILKPENWVQLRKLGIPIPPGGMLCGGSAEDRKLAARIVSEEAGIVLIMGSGKDFMNATQGNPVMRLRRIFDEARAQAPSLLFLDEVELIGSAHGKSSAVQDELRQEVEKRARVGYDGPAAFLVGGTDNPDDVWAWLRIPFGKMIELPKLDVWERHRVWEKLLSNVSYKLGFDRSEMAEELAAASEGLGGTAIKDVLADAERLEMERIGAEAADEFLDTFALTREDLLAAIAAANGQK